MEVCFNSNSDEELEEISLLVNAYLSMTTKEKILFFGLVETYKKREPQIEAPLSKTAYTN